MHYLALYCNNCYAVLHLNKKKYRKRGCYLSAISSNPHSPSSTSLSWSSPPPPTGATVQQNTKFSTWALKRSLLFTIHFIRLFMNHTKIPAPWVLHHQSPPGQIKSQRCVHQDLLTLLSSSSLLLDTGPIKFFVTEVFQVKSKDCEWADPIKSLIINFPRSNQKTVKNQPD